MSKDEYLITDAPLKALTVFAMPMILGSFFQQVYNMADSIIVGQFVGSSALAAVGACAALTNVFICVALGAGVGAGVLVSRYFGAQNYSKMKTIVSTSLISFLILSILLGVFGFVFSHFMMSLLQTPADILDEAVLYLRVYFVGFPFLFMYNILSTMFNSIGESKIPLGLLIFSSVLNIVMDLWMVAGLGLGVFGAALATLIAQGISAVFSLLIFFNRMRRYKSRFNWFDRQELHSMLRIAVPSVLQQSTVSIGMMIVQAVVNPFGTQALAGYAATMRVENVFSLIFVSIGNAVSPYVSQNLGAKKIERIKKGYHAALVLDLCFAVLAFIVIETLHTHISSLFLGKDGTALAYQVSSDRKATRRGLKNAHSALNDCKTTYSLLVAIVRETKISSFEELFEFSEQARYPTHIFYGKYKSTSIKDLEDKNIHWLLGKTDDPYLKISLENELLARSSIDEQNELPFN